LNRLKKINGIFYGREADRGGRMVAERELLPQIAEIGTEDLSEQICVICETVFLTGKGRED
jgi:hypothetical protein